MLVNIDFVPFRANYASGCVAGIIYMAWLLTKAIYAGVYNLLLFWNIIHLNILDKNTLVTLYVLPMEYAK